MATCAICGEVVQADTRTCAVCGTRLPDNVPVATMIAPRPAPISKPLPPGARGCPSCGQTYGADYTDAFCVCGVELATPTDAVVRPEPGTPMLVLFGPDKRPVRYFALTKDATLIGRLDAVGGHFPDIDLAECLDAASARHISRRHALVLRSRTNQTFSLRPLDGNTGTQIESDMVLPGQDYPLAPGTRLVLGGAVRLKFEA